MAVVLHEMRPVRQTEAHKTDGLAELVCSNSFRSDDAGTNAVGLLHEEMRRAQSLIMAAGDRHKLPAGGALAVDRDLFSARCDASARRPSADQHRARRSGRAAAGRLGQRHHRHRAADLAGPVGGHPAADRGRGTCLLRCHRADRASRLDRREHHLAAVALRQGGAWRHRRRLHQLSDEPGAVRGVRRCAAGRRQDLVQGVGGLHALLRRLPADRGDGRARPRDAALRADEAGRADQSTQAHRWAGRAAARGCAAAPGQCAGHAVEHGRLPDQAEARRAGARACA